MAKTYDGGIVTAYGAAVRAGYTGTYEQFCAEQAQFGANAAAVAAAKTAVDSAKSQVDQTVNTFTQTTVPNAESSVQSAGTEQIGLVQSAGTAQVQAVEAAGAQQVSGVQTEGASQIHDIEQGALSAIGQINDAENDAVAAVEAAESEAVAAGSDAVAAVEAAETAATGAVTAAQTTAVQAVTTAQSTAVSAVQAEGASQVQAVQTKGEETLESIPADYTALTRAISDKDLFDDIPGTTQTVTFNAMETVIRAASGNEYTMMAIPETLTDQHQAGLADTPVVGTISDDYTTITISNFCVMRSDENFQTVDYCHGNPVHTLIINLDEPLKADHTAIVDAHATKAVSGVSYVNLAGQTASTPFQGVNIVVTRYTDGTTSTTKVVR